MALAKAEADALKNKGNEAFAAHNWPGAIDLYTKAIDKFGDEPTYYSNRAQANIKAEAYGYAIADATKALELDPTFVKALFRRAVASTAILRPKDAVRDFSAVLRIQPSNADAKLKLAECQKIVRQLAFFAAIEVGDEPSVAESIDLDGMGVDADYDGLHLDKDTTMTMDFIHDMLQRFKNGKRLHRKYAYQIVIAARAIFAAEDTLVEVEVPEGKTLTVCGDTHGQFFDVLELFRLSGMPDDNHWYLFNGDFVDRGSWSTEVALTFYCFKLLRPKCFYLLRGNHESESMNRVYGFAGEAKEKYSELAYKLFQESFEALPLGGLIGKQYLVVHGGLFSEDDVTLDDIRAIDRLRQRQPGESGLMMEMLWTDPQPEPGRGPSKRGVGVQFGPDVTKRFCEKNGLKAIIRSHEVAMNGYEVLHDGRCITVFSAPKYVDSTPNLGAYINIRSDYELEFKTFDAVPHPPIRPMAYAHGSLMSSLGS